jgi:PIN domain nuclease of toxin-antitoxin system
VLWALASPELLLPPARQAITDADELVTSVVSPWELVIKAALGKVILHHPVDALAREFAREFGARPLEVALPHVLAVGALPLHHGDPFDRLLIAQAKVEGLTLVTRDRVFADDEIQVVPA